MNLNKLKTADELTAKAEPEPKTEGEAPETEAPEQDTNVNDSVQFITPGIARFRVGDYQFENGSLTLSADEAAEFQKVLDDLPPSEACRIQRVNTDAAEAIAAQFRAQQSKMTAGVDTSDSGEAARQAQSE